MQNAKDTFYITLRDRVAALNPARTIVLRGQTRPGVLVEENELASAFDQQDAFRLRWTTLAIDSQQPAPLAALRCEILYATAGSSGNGGMDRGRLLEAMDAELFSALHTAPQNALLQQFASDTAAVVLPARIFWGNPAFNPVTSNGELLERTATVDVFTYQNQEER
ncbi:MAG: hypothetical protein PW789_08955 [Edaphobacter sp.]|uniref:hypothetical protein n=1 Tax=Edaphobacter sp. TaxID=1934404 RepID=UPI0023890090|nr:hypothetical protein [Edaphobacter sp.]MDE1176725.1 hypothetical protein [Edaphobacter sp.]